MLVQRFPKVAIQVKAIWGIWIGYIDICVGAYFALVIERYIASPRCRRITDRVPKCAQVDKQIATVCLEPSWRGLLLSEQRKSYKKTE